MNKSLEIIADGQPLEYSTLEFSGGEVQVRITDQLKYPYSVIIRAHIVNSSGLMELLLMTDALRRVGAKRISLVIPYLPYARQDRVCSTGESLSLKVFCDIINSQNYESVEVWDVHSDVSLALLNRVHFRHQSEFVSKIFIDNKNTYLVAPDAGALKKIHAVSELIKFDVIRADKTRDVSTGTITGTVVYCGWQGSSDMLIVDDICDGGYTFLQLAKELRTNVTKGKINLYVTHGIFSKGVKIFEGIIDKIYCPNVFPNVADHKLLQRIY